MVDPGPPRPPQLMAKSLATVEIPPGIAAILMAHPQTIREDGAALSSEKCSGQGIHSFLEQLVSRVEPVPGLERVTMVGVNPYGRVHLMHLLFSV